VGHAGLLMQHLVMHLGKKVQKTGQILTLYFYCIFEWNLCPHLLWVFKWHLKMKTSENENLTQSIRPKSEIFGTGLGCQYCSLLFPRGFRVLAYQRSGLPHDSHTRLRTRIVPVPSRSRYEYTAAIEVLP
jgi:hypothetical protein